MLVSLYLRLAFRVCIFLLFVTFNMQATLCDFSISDYYKSILFHVGSSAISSHCGTMTTWANDLQ